MLKSSRLECEICNGNLKPAFKVWSKTILKCDSCNLKLLDKKQINQDFIDIYKQKRYFKNKNIKWIGNFDINNYYGYCDYIGDTVEAKKTFEKYFKVLERLKEKKGSLLDIGCATGILLELAEKRGWKTIGIDISNYAVEKAKQKGLNVLNITLKEAMFTDKYFDVIISTDTIEHLYYPTNELREMHRILKDDGLIILVTPNCDSFAAKIFGKRWEEYRRVKEHFYFFSKKTLSLMLKKAGFEILDIISVGKYFSVYSFLKRFGFDSKFFKDSWIGRINFYFNPKTKILCFAKKKVLKP